MSQSNGRKLSPTELEIARARASGIKPKEIAVQRGLSYGTVRVHLRSVYRKLQIHSSIALALEMQRRSA